MTVDASELGTIESVNAGVLEYVFVKRGVGFFLTLATAIALSGALLYAFFYTSITVRPGAEGTALILALLPLAAPLMLFIYWAHQVQRLFMQQLAQAIGFVFSDTTAVPAGSFFRLGHSQRAYDCLSGSYKGFPVRIFIYRYTVGSGKNQHTYTDTVFEIHAATTLPHVVMNLPDWFATIGMEKVELEGEFNRSFSVHVEQGKQMEVREVLQPDVMAELIDAFSHYCVEFFGTDIYLIRRGEITLKQDFLDTVAAVDKLFDTVIPEFAAMRAGGAAPAVSPPLTSPIA